MVLRGLGVHHALERDHVVLHEIGHDLLGQVRVGRLEERPEGRSRVAQPLPRD